MSSLTKQRAILVKIQPSADTDPVPAANTNFIRCGNITTTPFDANVGDRQRAYPNFGANAKAVMAANMKQQFDVELAGAGAAGTAPAYGPLLRGCGLAETISAGVKVQYDPVSAAFEMVTIYSYEGGALHKLINARGDVGFYFNGAGIPYMRFSYVGTYSPVTEPGRPTVTETGFIDGIEVNKANTTFSLLGYAAVLESLQLTLGNAVNFRDRPNAAYVPITDRQGNGKVTIEAPAIGTKDYFAAARANTLGVLDITHGTVAGNIVEAKVNQCQVLNPSYTDLNGVRGLDAGLVLARSGGDDDFSFIVK